MSEKYNYNKPCPFFMGSALFGKAYDLLEKRSFTKISADEATYPALKGAMIEILIAKVEAEVEPTSIEDEIKMLLFEAIVAEEEDQCIVFIDDPSNQSSLTCELRIQGPMRRVGASIDFDFVKYEYYKTLNGLSAAAVNFGTLLNEKTGDQIQEYWDIIFSDGGLLALERELMKGVATFHKGLAGHDYWMLDPDFFEYLKEFGVIVHLGGIFNPLRQKYEAGQILEWAEWAKDYRNEIKYGFRTKEKFEKMSHEKFELLVEGNKFYAYFLFEEKYHIKFEIDVSNQTEAVYWVNFLNKNNQWLHWDNYEDGLGEYVNIEESRRAHPSDRIPVIVERGRRIPYGFKRCPFFDREAFFSRLLDFIRDEEPEYEEYEETLRPYEGVYEHPF